MSRAPLVVFVLVLVLASTAAAATIPAPSELLGFELGSRPASSAELRAAFETIAAASPRVALRQYGESYEGRPLMMAVVGDPSRVASLEALLAGRRAVAAGEKADTPLALWIGACVHGDETSGSDASLALLHHLASDASADTRDLLERCVILIDPVQNPDGRARFLSGWHRWNGAVPIIDDQDMGHREGWPSARGNHYLLDLNRDWFTLSQRETRARVRVFLDWHPELSFDLHEMGSFDSYLFSPPRAPYNPHMPTTAHRWWQAVADEIAANFGRRGWSCYTGDWNEEFNPNRGAAWPLHLGTVAFLGEQASSNGRAILRPDGSLLDYPRAVEQQLTAAMGFIRAAARDGDAIRADFLAARKGWSGEDAAGTRLYVVDASARPAAAARLADLLTEQGIEVGVSREKIRLDGARSYWGETRGRRDFPAGSLLIDLAQPEGRLAAAILDFDPILGDSFLTRERRKRESDGGGLLYESSAWSLAMACGAEVYASDRRVRAARDPYDPSLNGEGRIENGDASYGFLLAADEPGAELALAACHRLALLCRGGEGAFSVGGREYGPGSVLLPCEGNPADLPALLTRIARESGAGFHGIDHALVDRGEDFGSRHFRVLKRPRIALLGGPPFYQTTFGALWHYLDRELLLPVTRLRFTGLARADLDRYTVIVAPDAGPGRGAGLRASLGEEGWRRLQDWLRRGGTLVTLGEGGGLVLGGGDVEGPAQGGGVSTAPLGSIRARRHVLAELADYRTESAREIGLESLAVDGSALREGEDGGIRRIAEQSSPGEITAEQDAWQRRFSPMGAILRADLDAAHWLSAGAGERVPVLVRSDMALMARRPAESVGRFAPEESLRLSGLLWPEARERWANSAYLSREAVGEGQVIVFLGNPVYRRVFHGSSRLFANALLLGPGMGTRTRPGD